MLKSLLGDLISKAVVEGRNHPKLLLRRTESIAEKMLTSWFTFLLYPFLRHRAGGKLLMLWEAVRQQVHKGPVDCVSHEARYSLSEEKLIRHHIDFKSIVSPRESSMPLGVLMSRHHMQTLRVQEPEGQWHSVRVLDCDSIGQVKDKVLENIYKLVPFSARPCKDDLQLGLLLFRPVRSNLIGCHVLLLGFSFVAVTCTTTEWFDDSTGESVVLQDLSTQTLVRQLNTLRRYGVRDNDSLHITKLQHHYNNANS